MLRTLALLSVMMTRVVTSALHGDFDCDGRTDTAVLSQGSGAALVQTRFADPRHKTQTFRFPVDSFKEDAICRLPAHLVIEKHGKCEGFALVDEACDSIHFYWDGKKQRLEWWRL